MKKHSNEVSIKTENETENSIIREELFNIAKELAIENRKVSTTFHRHNCGKDMEDYQEYINIQKGICNAIESVSILIGKTVFDELVYGES